MSFDFEIFRRGLLSYGCICVRFELNWNSVVLFLRRVEMGKTLRKTSRSERDSEQEPQLTCDDDSGIQTGWQVPSHRCANLYGTAQKSRLAV